MNFLTKLPKKNKRNSIETPKRSIPNLFDSIFLKNIYRTFSTAKPSAMTIYRFESNKTDANFALFLILTKST